MTIEEWVAAQLAAAPPFTAAQLAVLRPVCQRMGQHMKNAAPACQQEPRPGITAVPERNSA